MTSMGHDRERGTRHGFAVCRALQAFERNGSSGEQGLQVLPGLVVGPPEESGDDGIHLGDGRPGFESPLRIADDPSGVERLRDADEASAVPFPRLVHLLRMSGAGEQHFHLGLRESVHPRVHAGTDAVLRHAVQGGGESGGRESRDPRDDGGSQRRVALKRAPQGVVQELGDLLVQLRVAAGVPQGGVAVVDQDDGFPAVVGFDHPADVHEGPGELVAVALPVDQLGMLRLQGHRQPAGALQFRESPEDPGDPVAVRRLELLEAGDVEASEVEADDAFGVLPGIVRTDPGDLQMLEAVRFVGVFNVEVRVQHAEVEGLPETSGAGDDPGLLLRLQDIVDEPGFVHVVASGIPQFSEIADSNWHPSHDTPVIEKQSSFMKCVPPRSVLFFTRFHAIRTVRTLYDIRITIRFKYN